MIRQMLPAAAVFGMALWFAGCTGNQEFRLPRAAGRPLEYQGAELRLEPEPVLTRGAPGEWDSSDALNPTIVRAQGLYWNFYSGFDGRVWSTGLAVSRDGRLWEKRGQVISPDPQSWEGSYIAANGSAVALNGEFLYWYQAGSTIEGKLEDPPPRIGLARSRDGLHWSKHPKPVLTPGPWMSWDERGVADPYVIRSGGLFYLYYLGQDRARRQSLGVAVSADGIRWRKLRRNPVLEPGPPGSLDENGLGEPAVWQQDGWYWMLYTGRSRTERRTFGLARSADGVTWEKLAPPLIQGLPSWASQVLCDAEVELEGTALRVWFGGGDVAAPAERLNGQVGLGKLEFSRRVQMPIHRTE